VIKAADGGFHRSAALAAIQPSATIAITQLARDLKKAGQDVISLSIGEPDFPTPDNIQMAALRAIQEGQTKYPPVGGILELKDAVRRKFQRENSLDYLPAEIIVGNGCKQVIATAMMATLDPGDEVIMAAPYYVSYLQLANLFAAKPVIVATSIDNGFLMRPEDLERAITPRTKWVILNSPGNPSGAVYSRYALSALAEVLVRYPHVMVLSDDIYEHLVYSEDKYWTIAEIEPRLKERTLTANGVSKAYSMTGWRIGYGGGPAPLIQAMELAQSQLTGGACRISQWAAVEALDGPQESVRQAREIFLDRRNVIVAALNKIPGLTCRAPDGAFYAYPSCRNFLGRTTAGGRRVQTDEDFCAAFLVEHGVSAVQGAAFGLSPHFRISFAASMESLDEACNRLKEFCRAMT